MKKKIILGFILVLALGGLGTYALINYGYSKGARSGKLVKLSKKGFIFKTYEGTLDLGSGDQLTWDFSIHEADVGEELLNKMGKTVKLEYRELLFKLFFHTKYDVINWQIVRDQEAEELLCRLVHQIRQFPKMVEALRPRILSDDPSLLSEIRKCQK